MKFVVVGLMTFLTFSRVACAQDGTTYLASQTTVSGASQSCKAYYYTNSNRPNLPLFVYIGGTGIYSIGDLDTRKLIRPFLKKDLMNVVTIDKPGIEFIPDASPNFAINEDIYNAHTQRDLVACLQNAIRWASHGGNQDIYIVGYSEGTQVASRLYAQWLNTEPSMAARIKVIFLSGVVMNNWKDDLSTNHDPKDLAQFWQAYNSKDNRNVRKYGDDLPYAYWKDIFRTEAMKDSYHKLALQTPPVQIEFFQGLQDTTTPIAPILDFDNWNLNQDQKGLNHLILESRYYQANHSLSDTLYRDLTLKLMSYVDRSRAKDKPRNPPIWKTIAP